MAQVLPLIFVFITATGCGYYRSPSSSSASEYEGLHGGELAEARRLHAEGKVKESAAILRPLMSDANWQVRASAISVAGELREPALLPELHQALKDPMLFVRERASRVLQTVGDASSLPPLRDALSSEPDAAVRGNIAEALAKIGGATELPALTQVLQHDKDEGVRARTATALGAIGDSRARSALEESARADPDSGVRASAAAALEKLNAAGNH